jgi:two-component system sensor histidine kinase AlgZ
VQAVFHLILVGELLAIALTVAQTGVLGFSWNRLGVASILIQWVVLAGAACLCPLRPWFKRQHPMVAGLVSYLLVLVITLFFSLIGTLMQSGEGEPNWDLLLTNFMLAAVFAGIVLRYFYLQQQLRNQQQAELTARIQALQARIRPHFLFNSMNSIASLIDFDPAAAEKMVVDLSELFRASLSDPGLIPLERELELCRRFVAIEQMRIGDRLQVGWDLDTIRDVMVPSLLLQPLIENAIYHGIEPLMEGGVVAVSVKVRDSTCEIRVLNPVGDKRQASSKNNGMALDNIRHRLEAHYGKKGGLEVTATPQHYQVRVWFPSQPPAIT